MMKKAFYFFLLIITVAVACRKVDEPTSVVNLRFLPGGIYSTKGFDTIHWISTFGYQYDLKGRLISFGDNNNIYAVETDTIKNQIAKRITYDNNGNIVDVEIYEYDALKRISKTKIFRPFRLKTKDETQTTFDQWNIFGFNGSSMYPTSIRKYKVAGSLTANEGMDSMVIENNNVTKLLHYTGNASSYKLVDYYEYTYDKDKNIFIDLPFNCYIINEVYSANNQATSKHVLITKTGTDSVAEERLYKVEQKMYDRPWVIYDSILNNTAFRKYIRYEIDTIR